MTTLIRRLAFVMLQLNHAKPYDTLNELVTLNFCHLICTLCDLIVLHAVALETHTAPRKLSLALLGTYTGRATTLPVVRGCSCCVQTCAVTGVLTEHLSQLFIP